MASTQSASDYYNRKRASQTKGSIPDGVDIMRAQQIHSELKKNLDSRLTQYKLNYTPGSSFLIECGHYTCSFVAL